jgi:hypothetical protein
LLTVRRDVGDQALVAKASPERRGEPHVVLNHENSHAAILPLNLRTS